MTQPKHLWSGDWRQDSAAAAEERARRRAQTVAALTEPQPPEPPPAPDRPTLRERAANLLRAVGVRLAAIGRPPRVAALVVLGALLVAGAAYGLSSALQSGGSQTATASTPWMGLEMETVPVNRVLVTAVVPGGPADRAGIGPGDLITQIDNQPVSSPGDVSAAVSGKHDGDTVELQLERGGLTYTTRVTLQARPAGVP